MRNRSAVAIASLVCMLLGVVAASVQTSCQIATVAGGGPGSTFGSNSVFQTVPVNIGSVDAIAKRPSANEFYVISSYTNRVYHYQLDSNNAFGEQVAKQADLVAGTGFFQAFSARGRRRCPAPPPPPPNSHHHPEP